MRNILMAVCVTTLSLGCEQAPVSDVREGVQEVIEDARTRADELRELSAEELRDLWAIEYRSLQVTNADLAAVDEQLNALGQERWDCYHVSEDEQGRVFYFKRSKSNALAYLTNLFRLGSITL